MMINTIKTYLRLQEPLLSIIMTKLKVSELGEEFQNYYNDDQSTENFISQIAYNVISKL